MENMEIIVFWMITIAILCITTVIMFKKKPLNLPGPKKLPIVGNLHQMKSKKLHIQLLEWAKIYGPVYYIWFGLKPVVVVTGSKQIHEVLVLRDKDFSGRTHSFIMRERTCGGKSMLSDNPTQEWRLQKKLLITTLKAYGPGLKRIEELTVRCTNEWIDLISNKYDDKEGLDPMEFFVDLTFGILNPILLNERSQRKEIRNRIKELVKLDYSIFARCMQFQGFLLDRLPLLRVFKLPLYTDVQTLNVKLRSLYVDLKRQELHQENANDSNMGNVSQGSLFSKLVEHQQGDSHVFDDDRTMWTLFEAYTAGTATTSTSLTYLFNVLVQNVNVQKNIQEEIARVVGTDPIKLEDRDRMPYTKATLLEMMRFVTINPVLVPHRTIRDTVLDGRVIPKGTEVWVNAWGLHHDDSLWDRPFQFLPERYLDSSGDLVLADHPNRKNLVGFGAGARVCPGETFAMSRMFLILTMVMQKFSVLPFSSDQAFRDTRDIDMGFILEPLPYKLKLERRY